MFVNDITGLYRGGIFGADFTTQIPVALNAWGQLVPCGTGTINMGGQVYNPAYGIVYNRGPQTFVPQTYPNFVPQNYTNFVPQTFGHWGTIGNQGFVPQTFGHVPTIGNHPFLPIYAQNVPFTNFAQTGLNTCGNVAGFANPWVNPMGFQAICR